MRILFYLTLIGWIFGSLVCTGLNINAWPFPSLNVFSELPKGKTGQWVIRVTSEKKKYELDPGRVLPMEFFVARSFVGHVARGNDDVRLNALLDYINKHLNEFRSGFDERWEKAKLNLSGPRHIQIILKVSQIERGEKYQTIPVAEYIVGEKTYVQ